MEDLSLREKVLKKAVEFDFKCYCVVHMEFGYIYMFHSNGRYDKIHEKSYGLFARPTLKENIMNNDLFIRAEKIEVCCGDGKRGDSWTYYRSDCNPYY